MAISERSAAGIKSPHIAIRHIMPRVLIATVLPPVFGPVITKVSKSEPRRMLVGTTVLASSSGCRAFLRLILPSLLSKGFVAFCLYASCALAKMRLSITALS